jgi:hypothetical protein
MGQQEADLGARAQQAALPSMTALKVKSRNA